jgi:hypothetical protein
MDQPANRLSVVIVRLSILTVRPPAAPALRRPQLPMGTPAPPAIHPSAGHARTGLRRLAAASVLFGAVVLFATVPAWVARQVVDSDLWNLGARLAAGVTRPDLPSHPLPLLLGSIVVLAAMSSSSGHRHHDRW